MIIEYSELANAIVTAGHTIGSGLEFIGTSIVISTVLFLIAKFFGKLTA